MQVCASATLMSSVYKALPVGALVTTHMNRISDTDSA